MIVPGDAAGCVRVYAVSSRQLLCVLPAESDRAAISCLAFSAQPTTTESHEEHLPRSDALAESHSEGTTGVPQPSCRTASPRSVLAAGSSSGRVRVYSISSSGLEILLSDVGSHARPVTGVAFAGGTTVLWTCGEDGTLASLNLGEAFVIPYIPA